MKYRVKFSRNPLRRRGSLTAIALFGMVALGLIGCTVYFINYSETTVSTFDPIIATVEKGEFVAQVLDQGEVQSSENVEIRCEVRARNGAISVIEVIPEGTRVSGGDFLVRLDSTSFEKELETQTISVANSKTSVIQAEAELATSLEALKEYEQGIFVEKMTLIENDIYNARSQIETAKQELTQAKAVLGHSKKLQGKGFITSQQLEADGFEVTRAEFALKTADNQLKLALTQKDVLERITRVKETVQLKSDIEAAKVKLANQRESLEVEKGKLEEINTQIDKCEIRVPDGVEGQVVYAKESSRGGNDWVLEEGTSVRERQVLIRLPNPDMMEVKALINEQSITRIRPGMPATIGVDALNNQSLTGIVTKVNQYAESSGWWGSSVRKYAVLVEIINPPNTLKPGMNASVSIETRLEQDAVTIPIQAVYAVQDRQFCLVKTGEDSYETREIEVDGDNSQLVLVRKGLKPGEQLVLSPGSYKEMMDLPALELDKKIAISDEMKTKIDALKSANAASDQSAHGPGQEKPKGGSRFGMPSSGAELIQQKDSDGDGKLTKDEAGSPYSFFFDRIDTDKDGFLTAEEAETSIQLMKKRMQQGGGGGRRGGPGQ